METKILQFGEGNFLRCFIDWMVERMNARCGFDGAVQIIQPIGEELSVASTILAAAGCHLILFTTGRGTPFGSVVPTIKIATNDALAANKPNWIDWNSLANPDTEQFAAKVLAVASGEQTQNEKAGAQAIALFKDGVTL